MLGPTVSFYFRTGVEPKNLHFQLPYAPDAANVWTTF